MDFPPVLIFLFLYFIRPHDWMPGLAVAKPITLTMAWALGTMLTRRDGLSYRAFLGTPHQWAMLLYFAWIVYGARDLSDTLAQAKSAFIFFVVTALALSSWRRLAKYLRFWTWMLVILCGIGIASLFGIDPTGAKEATASMQGRLGLGTVMHSNPNALGHSVVIAIPLLYFQYIWRRPVGSRGTGVLLIILVAYCVYLTESKGAYLVGSVTILLSQIIGRPRVVQIVLIAFAATMGVVAVTQLPRMEKLNRNEPGIQGRILAWEMARTAMKDNPTGVGWNNFTAEFRWEKEWVTKATHSSYVQIGAALGYTGLFLYAGIIACGFRTLLTARARTEQEERLRRMLYVLLFGFAASNFMVDRAYTVELFILMAAISAFHRLLLEPAEGLEHLEEESGDGALVSAPAFLPQPGMALAGAGGATIAYAHDSLATRPEHLPVELFQADSSSAPEKVDPTWPRQGIKWTRLDVFDAAATTAFFWFILEVWERTLKG